MGPKDKPNKTVTKDKPRDSKSSPSAAKSAKDGIKPFGPAPKKKKENAGGVEAKIKYTGGTIDDVNSNFKDGVQEVCDKAHKMVCLIHRQYLAISSTGLTAKRSSLKLRLPNSGKWKECKPVLPVLIYDRDTKPHPSSQDPNETQQVISMRLYSKAKEHITTLHARSDGSGSFKKDGEFIELEK